MHHISWIDVHNFRSCSNATFPLSDFTPLVGYNNGGKSNLLAAIRWLLRPYSLGPTDFFNSQSAIIISGSLTGITPEVLSLLSANHRDRIQPYCTDGILGIRRTQPTPNMSVRDIILDIRDPSVTDEGSDNAWDRNPAGISPAIAALFPEPIEIGAMEDAAEDIGKSKSGTTIGKLIAEVMEPIELQHGAAINQTLEGIKRKLEAEGADRAPELNQFDNGANEKLEDIFPGISIRLHIPTPEIKALFKDGTIRVIEEGISDIREIDQLGHGAQRCIQMALVRYLAEMKATGDTQNASKTLLLIDEPELYLHPQAIEQVRLALKTLTGQGYQVIFATHSPQMIEKEDLGNTLIICKTNEQGTYARKRIADAITETIEDAPSQARIMFELGNSNEILFSDRVIMVEGTTEQILLPIIFYNIKGDTLNSKKIGLVNMGGSGQVANGLRILNVIDIPAKAVVDLDYAFRVAPKVGLLTDRDEDVAVCCRICSDIAEKFRITLAEDGFPRNNENITASGAIAVLASEDEAKPHILNLHDKLKEQSIWMWTKGSFEDHLGIDKGVETACTECALRIQQYGCEPAIADYQGVVTFIEWIASN